MVSESGLDIKQIKKDLRLILEDMIELSNFKAENAIVIGCSTSEIAGENIGKSSRPELARTIFPIIKSKLYEENLNLAFQCCEHLNRALVTDKKIAENRNLPVVTVIPHKNAGGALAAEAYNQLENPVVVEKIKAEGGIDIGDTFIGMHLREVAVPIRSRLNYLGEAHVTLAKTRPKLIGGKRAHYPE